MPRILAPNHSFQRRGSQHSFSSRTSLNSELPLRRSSLTTRGYQSAAYESTFSLMRKGPTRRQTVDVFNGHSNNVTQRTNQNAEWDLQGTRQRPKTLSKDSLNTTESTQASSQSSSISTLNGTSANGTSSSDLTAAFALLMQQKTRGGGIPNRRSESQSVPCSPNPPSTLVSSFTPYCIIKEEPDCWGQFVDVQSKDEDLEKRSRVMRRYPGAPHSLPRAFW